MKCKKLFALLLSLCMIASSFVAVPVSAEGTTTITVGNVEAKPGDAIVVPVSISNNQNGVADEPGLTGLTLNVKYDASALAFNRKDTDAGEALPDLDLTKPGSSYTEGDLTFNWDGTDADSTDGEILLLAFTVLDTAAGGDYAVEVTVTSACDYDMQDVDVDVVNGKVTVEGAQTGGGKTTITVGDVTGAKPGDAIVVPVSISNNQNGVEDEPGLTGLTLNVKYDTKALAFNRKDTDAGEALPDLDLTKPGASYTEGDLTFNWDGTDADSTDGEILLIAFTVLDTAAGGDYAVEVTVTSACDYDMEDVEVDVVNGKVTVDGPKVTTITVGNIVGAKPGEAIVVPISISNNQNGVADEPGLTGLTLNIKYDTKALAFNRKDTDAGEALPDLDLTKPGASYTEGDLTFNWDGTDADSTDGEILLVAFTVLDTAAGGDYAVEVTVTSACDYDMQDVDVDVVNGTVNIDGPIHVHSYTSVVTKEPTCSEKGIRTFTCECDDTYTEEIPVNPDNHSYGEWEKDDENFHKQVCSACGDTVTEKHDWDNGVETKAPTCTDTGIKTYTCSTCSETKTEVLEALGHSYGKWEYADEDNHKKVCDCGDVVFEGHAWDEGVITKQPSHTKEGIKTYTCSTCSGTKTEAIPADANNHSYDEVVTKAPTCTETGIKTFTCECNDSYTEVIEALGHSWDAGEVTLAPTHTTTGIKTYTCTVCGDKSKTEVIPANADDHTYVGEVTTPATHTQEGVMTYKCICNDTYTESIPKTTDHEWDEGVITKPASHFATGIKTFTCTCKETYTEEIPVIPHEYGAWQSVDKTNHKKVCDCGNEVVEAHDWDAGVVTKEPTVTEEGIKTFTCPTCTATYTETIEKLPDPDKTTTVKVGDSEAQPGEEVIVPISISKNIGLTGLSVNIKYDDSILTLTGYETGDALADLTFTKPGDIKANPIKFLWDGVDADDTNGDVLLLTFKVADNAADATYAITAHDVTACDVNVEDIAVAVLAGSVTVHTHSMTAVAEIPATCTTAGTMAHYICSACNRTYADEAGKVLLATTVIPATGHTYGEWEKENDDSHIKECACGHVVREGHAWDAGVVTTPATCTEDGVKTYTCATCNGTKTEVIGRMGHAMSFRPEVPATCTEDGVMEHHICTICDAIYVLGQTTPVDPADLVIKALGHDLSAWAADGDVSHKRACSHCSYSEVAPHVWNAGVITTDATCTTAGVKTYTCTVCNGTKTEAIPATGHAMTFVAEVPAECEADGTKAHYLCANCGKTFEDQAGKIELTDLVIKAFGHKLNTGVITTPATCTEKGVKTYTCQVCGTYKVEEEIPAKGHTMTFNAEVPATCTATGTKAYYKCSVCGKTFEDQAGNTELTDLVIAALGHAWDSGVETKAPTCTTEGILTTTCANCGGSYTTIIPAKGHDTEFVAEIAATCVAAGTKAYYKCKVCSKTFEDAAGKVALTDLVIPAKGHAWDNGAETKAPTCTEDGVKTYTCTACGEEKTEVIPANGHTTSFVAKVDAVCEVAGTKAHYKCSVCNKAFEDKAGTVEITDLVIPAKEHTWNAGVVTTPATCTEDGVKTYTCTACGKTKTEAISAIGHAMTFVAEVPAECEADGTKAHYLCANCGKTFEDQAGATELTDLVITALGHAWDAGVVTTPATCTEDGVKTYTCTVCGEEKTEAIAAIGHAMSAVAEVPATCTVNGTKAHYLCANCGKTFEDQAGATELTDLVITALGHAYGEWQKDDADNHKKVCATCGDVVTETHAWDAGVVTTPAACTVDGVKTYTCTVCGEEKTEAITAPGHELGDWVAVDADNHKRECANCDYAETGAHTWDAGVITQQPTYGKDGVKTYTCTACGDQSKTETIAKKPAVATDTTITVGDITARNGHSIKVPVTISNNIGLTDLEFVFEYDTSVLTYVGAEQGTALKGLSLTRPTDKTASSLTFVWDGTENDYTDGDILYLNFTVSETAALGDYATTAYVSNSGRQDGNEAPVYINNGTISVIEYTLGDVNDDGVRNVRDVVLMRRYMVGGYGVTILEDAADVTRNGDIGTNDIVHLRRFILGGYPESDKFFN